MNMRRKSSTGTWQTHESTPQPEGIITELQSECSDLWTMLDTTIAERRNLRKEIRRMMRDVNADKDSMGKMDEKYDKMYTLTLSMQHDRDKIREQYITLKAEHAAMIGKVAAIIGSSGGAHAGGCQ